MRGVRVVGVGGGAFERAWLLGVRGEPGKAGPPRGARFAGRRQAWSAASLQGRVSARPARGRAARLHESADAENGVVEAGGRQELLGAVLDVHQRHLRVLVAVQDGAEDVPAMFRVGAGDGSRVGGSGQEGGRQVTCASRRAAGLGWTPYLRQQGGLLCSCPSVAVPIGLQ